MDTLQARTEMAIAAIRNAAPRIVMVQAQTALALVTLRVQSQGIKGASYSTKLYSTSWLKGKELNAGGAAYIKNNKLGNWQGFKAAQGLPASSVTATFTGRMFRSLTTVAAGQIGDVAQARIVASTKEDADKVKGNTVRYGDFLAPTTEERAELEQVGALEVKKILDYYFKQA